MKRLILDKLVLWKNKKNKKPLLLEGARQVGKTYILKEFGKKFFRKYHYINFEHSNEYNLVFKDTLNPNKIIENLKINFGFDIDIKNDLLIFDEIQESPNAITSLKYFCEDLNELNLVSAGSLLGVKLGNSSFPVGKIDLLEMYPLNFLEFLLALGKKDYFELINEFKFENSIAPITHKKLWEIFKLYLIVGGLPEVVNSFCTLHGNLNEALKVVREKQYTLIQAYYSDIAKHSGKTNSMHIEKILHNAALQLGKEENGNSSKFKFKDIIPGISEYARIENALNWLIKAGLILKCPILKQVRLPLLTNVEENKFKLFIFDVGILGCIANISPSTILNYDYGTYKGFFAENFVLQEIVCGDYRKDKIFSWRGKEAEIEFIREENGNLIAVEVKSGFNINSKSMKSFIDKFNPKYKIILSGKEYFYRKSDNFIFAPIYLSSQIINQCK